MGLHVRSRGAAAARAGRCDLAIRVAGRVRRLPGVIAIVVVLLLACAPVASAQPAAGPWDPLLPKVPSAGAPGDPVAIANASLQATAMATQTAMSMGRSFLSSLGIVSSAADPSTSVRGNRVNGAQAIEYVIRRAGTQIGVPYSWGGGSLTGPSRGVDQGAGTVGFDCSGLTRFAFAGVGVLLPRWSGDQYNAGRKVPPAQAKRGDLLFWGPGGSQHEAIYLGGGQMLEAQQTGVPIKISPVRMSGMTPYVVRIIES
ncbi:MULTISPECIES: NlpC/P60 family peptidoglycan endopeptidase RipB [Mycolicibacterium]|jgi:cell wall-associated NlpC family hydrolase|uniref:NLP/P60 protein n=2 Tax=Mycolicibacterium TaxID=1866885 RepID=W9AYZ3_MYCCO|nr:MULTISPECIES: NlpC/P60 family peptidoglycan endopeptidase RipB [Mycolicibacterium]OKH75162.1 peptidase C40 [Mycobacterium sp. SWH-M5]MBU8826992.1 NlpC/P60 family peptidoglycan endopeptidase RipB [Mycolicibacterium goodii]MBU8840484.1 NlpC/P60 family peptidoglycan endopeptidase RipB [Mycolicibacterium goodii]TLH71785.1 NlpC/P60 family protein [Mycolicibacterium cosmeticum]CDO08117.1 NLP/P60 protein [Mycolicibacterium cosmeticum]